MAIKENDPDVPLKNVADIKSKYIKTGKLKRWVAERTVVPINGSIVDKLKDIVAPIAVERRARRQIIRAIKTDITAVEWGYPRTVLVVEAFLPSAELDYGIFGNLKTMTDRVLDKTDLLVSQGGVNTAESTLTNQDPNGFQEVTVRESITGENITVRVGKNDDRYWAEEVGTDGRCISRAEISNVRNNPKYKLDLHFEGGRYEDSGAQINISSDELPRATIKTFDLLVGVVRQGSKNSIVEM